MQAATEIASSNAGNRPSVVPVERRRILVAEDDAGYRQILRRLLERQDYDVILADHGLDALATALRAPIPRLLILDWMMPGMQGPEICRALRARHSEVYQYILLLTGKDAKTDVVAGLEAGADDYLTKPFNCGELLARVHVGMRMLGLHDGLIAAQEQLRFHAMHDPLTGLWNRLSAADLLRAELERSRRNDDFIFVMMIDLDRFKAINDTYGHAAGDAVLREVANRWSECIRPYDVLCRFGGEEFVLCSTSQDATTPFVLAERLREAVASLAIETPAGAVRATASIGLAVATARGCNSVESLLHTADDALYRAKKNGRNRVEPPVTGH